MAEDAPGCLLPNGKVLLVVGPITPNFSGPSSFYEFDPVTNSLVAVPNPPNAGGPAFVGRNAPYSLQARSYSPMGLRMLRYILQTALQIQLGNRK